MSNRRPRLNSRLSTDEFCAWYWLKSELIDFCRLERLSPSGSKAELSERVIVFLAGGAPSRGSARRSRRAAMPETFTLQTRIAPGWRCTRNLSDFFKQHCGKGFCFNALIRDFVHNRPGATLAEAIQSFRQADSSPSEIQPQFEYNRHVRAFYEANPGASRQQMLDAWWAKRNRKQRGTGSASNPGRRTKRRRQ